MNGCACPHETNEHAPIDDFGISMCLVADCDCMGTREQVAAARVQRAIRMTPTAERVYDIVKSVLSNPMERTIDDQARNIAAAIIVNFEVAPR